MEHENILEVQDLHISFHTYAGEVQAVRGVDFEIRRGEILGIVGESGCGKSVTSNAIMRILQSPPAEYKSGHIMFRGLDLLTVSEKRMQGIRGKEIGMIFQDSLSSLNPTMKVGKQIKEVIRLHNKSISNAEAQKQAIDMLKAVGMSNPVERYYQYPHEFSGGMRQRAMIAIALALSPTLLIADEPTTALDVTIQAQILNIMMNLKEQIGTSVMLITHDLGVVAETCDRVAVMYAGEIVEKGNTKDIFFNPKHPYTQGLLDSVPSMDTDRSKVLEAIVGSPPDLFNPPKGCPFYARCKHAMEVCQNNDPELLFIGDSDEHYAACWLNSPQYLEFLAAKKAVK